MKLADDNRSGLRLMIDKLDNRKNDKMNDLLAIDHAKRDWIDDTDLMLPRVS